ncbi:uncharacterized protein LOC100821957 [Brachypodium distachyon]|uniref:uncharacterized protein LOC100821957 n=1 Tax=Brachypodium distachyon TaxID=15368 RepID=UPI0001C70B5D|nr:uncharacterized protein LOC100821957 [Brachypodium distachyon]|eukprot:XP_003576450.1 uncharacterized protein LOC100821957 [Brachypodium distachyon]
MDQYYRGRLRAFSRATLLGLVLFSVVTWVPHAFSCLRTFLFVSIPSAASVIATPKCLFVFSNIIVVFLTTESKLSRLCARSLTSSSTVTSSSTEEDGIDAVVRELTVFAQPMIKEKHPTEEIVRDQFGKEEDASSISLQVEDERVEEVMKEEEGEEEEEDETGLPTEELNRRVEDFIARFNMERQLEEARMIVCCC